MTDDQRRHDIDWLRVIAIGLLIIYHISIVFQPWGVFIGFIQSSQSMKWIWTLMSFLNIWRIPLLFFVSGMGVYYASRKRDIKSLFLERTKRILLPYIFGVMLIVPIHVLIWNDYYHQPFTYAYNPGHLWFLGNIFIYVLILLAGLVIVKKNRPFFTNNRIHEFFKNPFALLILYIPFVLEAEIVKPESFEMYAMTWHGFFLGFCAFNVGYICVSMGNSFWENIANIKWITFFVALAIYLTRVIFFDLRTPHFAMAVESVTWILAIFGFGYTYLNKPSNILNYLSGAAYPVYILHMIFLYLGCWLFIENITSAILSFVLLNIFTLVCCLLVYEFVIKRVVFLRPLFGLK